MANKFSNEDESFQRIREENIPLSGALWNLIYRNLSDPITKMDLTLNNYVNSDNEFPYARIKDLLKSSNSINKFFYKVLHPDKITAENNLLILSKNECRKLDPRIKELFSHHISNDLQALNFILGDYDIDEKNISEKDYTKVLSHIASIRGIVDRLRQETLNNENMTERIRNKLTFPITLLSLIKEGEEADNEKLTKAINELNDCINILGKINL